MRVTTTELWRLSARELAEAIRSRQTSSSEVIETHLRRIETVNPSVNAVTVVLGEQALDAAKAADRAVAEGLDLPPLHGVPFTVKGNIDARVLMRGIELGRTIIVAGTQVCGSSANGITLSRAL